MPRRALKATLGAALFIGVTLGPVPSSSAQIPVGGWSSPNVEWLGNVTLSGTTGAIQGALHGRFFYAESLEALEIFDVSDPLRPERVARITTPVPGAIDASFPYPDIDRAPVDTNGEILLHTTAIPRVDTYEPSSLVVYDVRDKAAPRLISSLTGVRGPFECILECRWSYSATGEIIDLRDPSAPRLAGRWEDGLDFRPPPFGTDEDAVDLNEIAPGRVLIASVPMYLLDVKNPREPRVLARSDGSPYSHDTAVWPVMGRNGIALSISQTVLAPRCELGDLLLRGSSADSAFKTWDTSGWKSTGLITGLSEYRLENGTYQDGNPAFSGALPTAWGCGTTEVHPHPRFANGGYAVVSGSSHGVKFLDIDKRGGIEEVGWFLPYSSDTLGAYWITDEIVYTTDWPRGIDILRFDANG